MLLHISATGNQLIIHFMYMQRLSTPKFIYMMPKHALILKAAWQGSRS